KTWSNAQYFLSSKGRHNLIPYMKVVSDNKSKIHFLFTDGHPKVSFSSVYHVYYENGAFHQTNGAILTGIKELPLDITKINKIYDFDKGKIKSWIWDIALGKKGNPVV